MVMINVCGCVLLFKNDVDRFFVWFIMFVGFFGMFLVMILGKSIKFRLTYSGEYSSMIIRLFVMFVILLFVVVISFFIYV